HRTFVLDADGVRRHRSTLTRAGPPGSRRCTVATMPSVQRLAILTSGGDAPGMNAAIRAATLVARTAGIDVVGVERGYRGLLDGAFVPLDTAEVQGILR